MVTHSERIGDVLRGSDIEAGLYHTRKMKRVRTNSQIVDLDNV